MAYIIVLTEGAEVVTVCNENSPGAAGSDQGVFFSEMWAIAGNHGPGPGSAYTLLFSKPVYAAFARTDTAFFKHFFSLLNPFFKKTFFVKAIYAGWLTLLPENFPRFNLSKITPEPAYALMLRKTIYYRSIGQGITDYKAPKFWDLNGLSKGKNLTFFFGHTNFPIKLGAFIHERSSGIGRRPAPVWSRSR